MNKLLFRGIFILSNRDITDDFFKFNLVTGDKDQCLF